MKIYKTNQYALEIAQKDLAFALDSREELAAQCQEDRPNYAAISGGYRGTLDVLINGMKYLLGTMQEVSENEHV